MAPRAGVVSRGRTTTPPFTGGATSLLAGDGAARRIFHTASSPLAGTRLASHVALTTTARSGAGATRARGTHTACARAPAVGAATCTTAAVSASCGGLTHGPPAGAPGGAVASTTGVVSTLSSPPAALRGRDTRGTVRGVHAGVLAPKRRVGAASASVATTATTTRHYRDFIA